MAHTFMRMSVIPLQLCNPYLDYYFNISVLERCMEEQRY